MAKTISSLKFVGESYQGQKDIVEIVEQYDVDEGGTIQTPGKFENEPIYAPVVWNWCLDGSADYDDGKVYGIQIDDTLVQQFPMLSNELGQWLCLEESGQGFVNTWIQTKEPEPDEDESEDEDD